MATYIKDSFTDANTTTLNAHTPDIGGVWSGGASITIVSNQIVCASFTNNHTSSATLPGTPDYEVSMNIISSAATGTGSFAGVVGRYNVGGGNWYQAAYDASNQQYELSKFLSASKTSLGTVAHTYVQGETHNVKLRLKAANISLVVDGITLLTVVDTSMPAKDQMGVYMEDASATQALQGDNFLAEDLRSLGNYGAHVSVGDGMSRSEVAN